MTRELERWLWRAYRRRTPAQRERLIALVGGQGYLAGGPLGIAPTTQSGSTFDFDEGGSAAVIAPARTAVGELADLVAWRSDNPGRWWAYSGTIPILGAATVERCDFLGLPLAVYATPLAWLQSGCRGCCVLDWNRHVGFWLVSVDRLLCDSPALAQRLGDTLERDGVPAKVRVWEERHADAA